MRLTRAELLKSALRASTGLALLGIESLARPAAAHAPGVAFLCGMDTYPRLRGEGRDLQGAGTNSVQALAKGLARHNFSEIHPLSNPTKTQILEGIATYAAADRPFLFYFLGHGSRNVAGDGTLLPADAEDENDQTNIVRDELKEVLSKVVREKRTPVTCIIDACDAWAVAYELGSKSAQRRGTCMPLRYLQFQQKDIQSRPRTAPPDSRQNAPFQPCFVVAADLNERAYVAPVGSGNKMLGVFSYHLAEAMRQAEPSQIWSPVFDQTTGACAEYAKKYSIPGQTPRITPAYRTVVLFETKEGGTVDLDRLFEVDCPKPGVLSVAVVPEKKEVDPAAIPVNANFDIKIEVAAGGYLVALEKTPSNTYQLHFPEDGELNSAKVAPGPVTLPTNRNRIFYHDRPGPDTFKLFFYPNPEGAQKLLSILRPAVAKAVTEAQLKEIRTRVRPGERADVLSDELVTATIRFDVRPEQGGN